MALRPIMTYLCWSCSAARGNLSSVKTPLVARGERGGSRRDTASSNVSLANALVREDELSCLMRCSTPGKQQSLDWFLFIELVPPGAHF